MKKLTKKLIAISILGLLPALSMQVHAQSNKLVIPKYDSGTLKSAGCEPQVWTQMVADYTAKRGLERGIEYTTIKEQLSSVPKSESGSGSCFQSATQNINNAMKSVNAVMSLFSGGLDFSSLASGVASQIAGAACKQIDTKLGEITGGVTNTINTATTSITGASINTGTSAGSINVGQYATVDNQTATQIPYVSTNSAPAAAPYVAPAPAAAPYVAPAASPLSSDIFQDLNPFRKKTPSTPDALK